MVSFKTTAVLVLIGLHDYIFGFREVSGPPAVIWTMTMRCPPMGFLRAMPPNRFLAGIPSVKRSDIDVRKVYDSTKSRSKLAPCERE